jgi:hypothetical protein
VQGHNMLNLDRFTEMLNTNSDFAQSGKFFDGSIQLNIGQETFWIKAFMGSAIYITHEPPPFGFTFAVKGSVEDWRFAIAGSKNRFREALITHRLCVEGNQIEFTRVGKAVHGLSDVLMQMVREGSMTFEERS